MALIKCEITLDLTLSTNYVIWEADRERTLAMDVKLFFQ